MAIRKLVERRIVSCLIEDRRQNLTPICLKGSFCFGLKFGWKISKVFGISVMRNISTRLFQKKRGSV
jgi:hypothetical protein